MDQLTFYTARGGKGYRVLGPYGSGKHENPFQVVGSYHQVVAFFGRSGLLVDQIGIATLQACVNINFFFTAN